MFRSCVGIKESDGYLEVGGYLGVGLVLRSGVGI